MSTGFATFTAFRAAVQRNRHAGLTVRTWGCVSPLRRSFNKRCFMARGRGYRAFPPFPLQPARRCFPIVPQRPRTREGTRLVPGDVVAGRPWRPHRSGQSLHLRPGFVSLGFLTPTLRLR